jgi:hypothetical protein
LPEALRERYAARGAEPVRVEAGQVLSAGYRLYAAPLLAQDRLVRHDERKLARAVLQLVLRYPPQEPRRRLAYFLLSERLRREDLGE